MLHKHYSSRGMGLVSVGKSCSENMGLSGRAKVGVESEALQCRAVFTDSTAKLLN